MNRNDALSPNMSQRGDGVTETPIVSKGSIQYSVPLTGVRQFDYSGHTGVQLDAEDITEQSYLDFLIHTIFHQNNHS